MIRAASGDREPSTTGGTIVMVNLHAQIGGLTAASPLLIDLLILRGHVLGRIADYGKLDHGTPARRPATTSWRCVTRRPSPATQPTSG
jgi:hypothetical protein